jgi:polar amino acid transport system permease protein
MASITKILSRYKTASIIIAAVLFSFVLLFVTNPPMHRLTERISPDLIIEGGARYSETTWDFWLLSVARGRNIRTAEADTYLGIAGMVLPMNDGFAESIGNILFWLPALLSGARITVTLTTLAVSAGLLASVFVALGRISRFKPLSMLCGAYIFFFRGTPLLMQLFFVYYGLPMINPALAINNKFMAAFIAFGLNVTAYSAEFIRAAIQSIDKGQFEAARALGFRYGQTMRLIVIPQSIRRMIPSIANEFIMVLKDASLVSIIALSDLTHTTRAISSSTASVAVFIPAMIIYLIITAFFTFIFEKLEKRFSVYH